jgi:stage III sporulation protein AB
MILKIIGSIIVLFSSGFLGNILSSDCRNRPQQLRELQALLAMLENRITYLSDVLVEAFETIIRTSKSRTTVFFEDTIQKLAANRNINAAEAWEAAVRENIKKTSLNREDEEMLVSFGKILGGSDLDGQVKNIRLTLEQLRLQERKAEESRAKNEGMYKSLGVLGGIAVVIVLI